MDMEIRTNRHEWTSLWRWIAFFLEALNQIPHASQVGFGQFLDRIFPNTRRPLEEIISKGVRGSPDVGTLASRNDKQIAIMVWHYHDDDLVGPDAAIELKVRGVPESVKTARVSHYRVDQLHSNSYDAWRRMGSPVAPGRKQYAELQAASNLATLGGAEQLAFENGNGKISFRLPRQGVSLVVLEYQ